MHRQSPQCRECYLAGHKKPENYITKNCPVCGKEFTRHKGQRPKYCSRSCARSGSPTKKRKRHIVECPTCGKSFERHLSESKRRKGKQDFCSRECWCAYNRRDNHYLWSGGQDDRMCPEGREWRKKIIARDKGLCRLCLNREKLEAHHILPFGTYPEERWKVTNGLTLCHNCHVRFRHQEEQYTEALLFIASVEVVVW